MLFRSREIEKGGGVNRVDVYQLYVYSLYECFRVGDCGDVVGGSGFCDGIVSLSYKKYSLVEKAD